MHSEFSRRLLPPALVSCSVTVQMAGTHLGAGTGGLLVLPEAWGMQVRPWELIHRGEDHGAEGTSAALFLPAFPIGSWDTCHVILLRIPGEMGSVERPNPKS